MKLPSLFATFGLLVATLSTVSAQEPGTPPDHIGAYNFVVEIEGIAAGQFTAVDGLSMEMEVIEYRDGTDLFVRKRPGRAKFGNITLKRGYINNTSLFEWVREIMGGNFRSRNMNIHLNDGNGAVLQTWNLYGCWPKQWKVNSMDGKGNDVVTEEIELVVEDLVLAR